MEGWKDHSVRCQLRLKRLWENQGSLTESDFNEERIFVSLGRPVHEFN
jgi:hypothetical protein